MAEAEQRDQSFFVTFLDCSQTRPMHLCKSWNNRLLVYRDGSVAGQADVVSAADYDEASQVLGVVNCLFQYKLSQEQVEPLLAHFRDLGQRIREDPGVGLGFRFQCNPGSGL